MSKTCLERSGIGKLGLPNAPRVLVSPPPPTALDPMHSRMWPSHPSHGSPLRRKADLERSSAEDTMVSTRLQIHDLICRERA